MASLEDASEKVWELTVKRVIDIFMFLLWFIADICPTLQGETKMT
jgi:hypothetical protein